MAHAGQGQQQESGLGPLWIAVGVAVLAALLWYFGHTHIVRGVIWVKQWELRFLSLFTNAYQPLAHTLEGLDPANVAFKSLVDVSRVVGQPLSWPMLVIMALLSWILWASDLRQRFRQTYRMEDFLDSQQASWYQLIPSVHANLQEVDIDDGVWAMCLSPLQFAKKHGLLKPDKTVKTLPKRLQGNRLGYTMTIDRTEASHVFNLQLGAYWQDPKALPIHARALFAVFSARINHDLDAGNLLLERIATSTRSGELAFVGVDVLLEKYVDTKEVQKIVSHHAFVLTVMASMLEGARRDGVLPTAEFLWLKPIDRPLWFMLNNVGRQTAFVEVAGPMGHWFSEKAVGRPLFVPMVHEAVNGLEEAIKEILYVTEPGEALPGDDKAGVL